MSEAAMLSVAGAIILVLLGVIGFMVRQDRQSIATTMAAGFAELKTLIGGVAAQAQRLERDCVTWADLEKVNLSVGDHEKRITVIETTCKQERGGT